MCQYLYTKLFSEVTDRMFIALDKLFNDVMDCVFKLYANLFSNVTDRVFIQYRSDPTWHQSKTELNPGFTFGVYLGLTLGLRFENLGLLGVCLGLNGVVFCRFTWKLHLKSTVCTEVWTKTRLLSCYSIACSFFPMYIQNTQLESAFRVYFWLGLLSVCTLDLLPVYPWSTLVNPE